MINYSIIAVRTEVWEPAWWGIKGLLGRCICLLRWILSHWLGLTPTSVWLLWRILALRCVMRLLGWITCGYLLSSLLLLLKLLKNGLLLLLLVAN